jgi:hypothetical protein
MFKIEYDTVIIASNNGGLTLAAAPLLCALTAGVGQYGNRVKRSVQLWQ